MRFFASCALVLSVGVCLSSTATAQQESSYSDSIKGNRKLERAYSVLQRVEGLEMCLGVVPGLNRSPTRIELAVCAHAGLQQLKVLKPRLEGALASKKEKAIWDLVFMQDEVDGAVEVAIGLLKPEFELMELNSAVLRSELVLARQSYLARLRAVVSSKAPANLRSIVASALLHQEGFGPVHFTIRNDAEGYPTRYEMAVCADGGNTFLQNLTNHLEQQVSRNTFDDEDGLDLQRLVAMNRDLGPSIKLLLELSERELAAMGVDSKMELGRFATVAPRIQSMLESPFVPFLDVPSNHWAAPAVNELKAAGLLKGYPGVKFSN